VDARTQSALLAAIVSLALALAMLLRPGRTRLWTAFALLNVSLLAYQMGDFLHGLFGGIHTWPLRVTLAAAGVNCNRSAFRALRPCNWRAFDAVR